LFGLISLGAIIGGVGIFGRLGEALGAPLSGSIFDITASYRLAFLICIGICALAIILSLVLMKYKGKSAIAKA
jgi:nitrate/nitrite transporter NarK